MKTNYMKWVFLGSKGSLELFDLYKEEEKILSLSYDPIVASARIETNNEKRVYLVRKEGFRKNKIVLRNEYGLKMGKIIPETKKGDEGIIEINEEQFHFSFNSENNEFLIYPPSSLNALASCKLESANSVHSGNKLFISPLTKNCLLLLLGLQISQEVASIA